VGELAEKLKSNSISELDRDVVAAMNQSLKEWVMFARSKGVAYEAMRGNLGQSLPVILRVGATKLGRTAVEAVVNTADWTQQNKD
jgi:hypothetical protein